MATKEKEWSADFRRLLAPKIFWALKDDCTGKIPLGPAQRREALKLPRFGMTAKEISTAHSGARRVAKGWRRRTQAR